MLLFYDLLNCVSSAVESSCASSPGWSHDVVLLRMIVHNPDMFFGNLPVRSFLQSFLPVFFSLQKHTLSRSVSDILGEIFVRII